MATSDKKRAQAYVEQLQQELDDLRDTGVLLDGNIPSEVLFIANFAKDSFDETQLIDPHALDALEKSLSALGYLDKAYSILSSVSLTEIHSEKKAVLLPRELIRLSVEVIDPISIVSLDTESSKVLAQAFEMESFNFGQLYECLGRRVLNLSGFAKSLDDSYEKQRMWHALKLLPPEQAPL
ncbi:MAG: hypothetical protein Q4E22_01780 [Coriobacteriia bacterium]|nr:hypothetical protein [Coriobacteriia bacterium]